MKTKNRREYEETALVGGVGYCVLEMVWRGRTHWSMALAGGMGLAVAHYINGRFAHLPLWRRCLMGAAAITGIELTIGCLFNRRHKVWDYSQRPGNIKGQVCPLYSLLWFLLCMPLCALSATIRKKVSHSAEEA